MSKAQLSGAVGYTGFIRPSLQCTQQCSLKPGRHAQEAGSYWPKPLDLGNKTTNLRAGPETSNTAMSAQMSPETYNNHRRQDRDFHDRALRTSPLCSHWKSIGAEAFRLHTPPNGLKLAPPPHTAQSPVMPNPQAQQGKRPPQITTTAQIKSMYIDNAPPELLSPSGSPRRRKNKMREGSREFLVSKQDNISRDAVDGTTKVAKCPPGYMGHVPRVLTNSKRAVEQGTRPIPRVSQRCKEDTLFDSFNERPIGYLGYSPTTVFNRRTWSPPLGTTNGATDRAVQDLNYKLERPQAASYSSTLHEMFAGPLEGRPSASGEHSAQVFYREVRPFEGVPRGHQASRTHPAGHKFSVPVVTSKNWGNTSRPGNLC
jgi:hypothetical protein